MGNCFSCFQKIPTHTQTTNTCTSSSLGGVGVEPDMADIFLRLHEKAILKNQQHNLEAWNNMHYDYHLRCWVKPEA